MSVHSRPPGGRAVVFRPVIVKWAPPLELRWRATLFWARLFRAEHGFRVEPVAEDRVRLVQDETFRGLLIPLYSAIRLGATKRGFEQMNAALRERAESEAAINAP